MLKKNQNRILRKKEVKRMKIIKKTSSNEPKKKTVLLRGFNGRG